MKYSKTIKIKDGRDCLLRSAAESDGEAALDNFIIAHSQTDYLLTYPDEITYTVKDESEYLKGKQESENEIEILAIVDNKVVGTAGISSLGNKYKLKHRAEFGISIDKDYWGLGIGRALTSACIECAKIAGYTQLELDVMAKNTRAMELYKSEGFIEYGRNPKGFNSRISGFEELVLMRLELG
ncbi:MAG: GNAT family N-acetyltransferase [Clostridia bacterium]|nr:GNAT family N-acetyltransferase [Clostridia bacterium]